jgi:hypothetical protein
MPPKKPTVYEFIPKLGQLRDDVLFGDVWEHPDLSKRDRSLITVAMRVEGADHPRGVLCWLALRGQRWPYRHRRVRTEIARWF